MWRVFLFFALLAPLFAGGVRAYSQEEDAAVIKEIALTVSFSKGDVRPAVAAELKDAIQEVAELALLIQLEGDLNVLASDLEDVTETLARVINITLAKRGFEVESLVITPGESTQVDVVLAVSGDEIVDVTLEFLLPQAGDIPLAILEDSRQSLLSSLRRNFQGMPTADRKWALDLFDALIESEVENIEDLRGFDYRSEIVLGPVTRVLLHLNPSPGEQVIRRHYLRTRSSTLLNVSMDPLREIALVELSSLDGLPIALFSKYSAEIAALVGDEVAKSRALEFYRARPVVELTLKNNDLWASLIVESPWFRTNVEGRVDFNRDEDNPRIEGTFGVIGPMGAEAYANLKFFPDIIDAEPEAGLGINPSPGLFVGAGWDFDRPRIKTRGSVWLGTNINVTFESYTGGDFDEDSEYRVAYKLNDVFSVLGVVDGGGASFVSLGVKL